MKKILFISIAIIFYLKSFSQVIFQKKYEFQTSTPVFNSVKQTADGGYIFAGGSRSTNNHDGVFLMKTDSTGDTLWTKSFGTTTGTSNSALAKTVVQTFDGGYFIAGFTEAWTPDFNMYLVRTNNSGDTLWTRMLSHPGGAEDYCYSALQANDSNFVTFGRQGLFEVDFYLNKWNSGGNIIWSKYYSIPGNFDFGNSVQQTSDNGYIMAGTTQLSNANDLLVIKADGAGNLQWAKKYTGGASDECNVVRQTNDGGYIMAGSTMSFGAGSYDIFLVKTNSAGDTLWTHTYGTADQDKCASLKQTADHGYILTGTGVNIGGLWPQLLLMKLDSTGNVSWSKNYGFPSDNSEGMDVIETGDGGFMASGYTTYMIPGAYIVKTDALGNSGCNENAVPMTVGNAPFQVTTVTPVVGSNSSVIFPPTVVDGGAILTTFCTGFATGTGEPDVPVKSILLFPNPATNQFTISNLQFPIHNIEIYNVMGEKVFSQQPASKSQQQITIDVSDFPPGVYFVKLLNEHGAVTRKIIVHR